MIWSDNEWQCLGVDVVSPMYQAQINPASYDVRLDSALDILYPEPGLMQIGEEGFRLYPSEFALACTIEAVTIPVDMVGFVWGKSSLARQGLQVHTAGLLDPGFEGQITLELSTAMPIVLRRGMRIAQIVMQRCCSVPFQDYSQTGHYQYQHGPTRAV